MQNTQTFTTLVMAMLLLTAAPVDAARRRVCESTLLTEVVVKGGTFAATFGAVMVAGPALLGAIGFGLTGIGAGTVAAGVQSTIGNVGAGSLFAKLQSLGMTGVSMKSAAGIAAWASKNQLPSALVTALGLNCREEEYEV